MKEPSGIILGTPSTGSATGTLPAEQPLIAGEPETDVALWAVIFAGGIGSRFWPLSTPVRPKPLLALVSDQPLIEDAVGRLQPTIPPERVLILTSRDIAPAIRSVTKDVPEENVLVEPRPLGTAAALAWAAQELSRRAGPSAMLVAVHADLAVDFPGLRVLDLNLQPCHLVAHLLHFLVVHGLAKQAADFVVAIEYFTAMRDRLFYIPLDIFVGI